MKNPITEAQEKAGSQVKLAAKLAITPQAVRKYEKAWDAGRLRSIPAERAIQLEREVGMPRHRFRPDLWDAPESASRDVADDQP